MPVFQLDSIVAAHPGEVSDEPITTELAEQLAKSGANIEGPIMRYLYNRLAKLGSAFGWRDLLLLIGHRPEETAFILAHMASLNLATQAEPLLLEFLRSPQAIYDYQNYQLLYWVAGHVEKPTPSTLDTARTFARSGQPWYVRMAARWILAVGGEQVDLERMAEDHRGGPDLLREDIDLLCCLQKLERTRRNRLMAQAAMRKEMYGRELTYVKGRD